MKNLILIPLLLVMLAIGGCTADDPGFTTVVGNPEVKVVDSDGNIITIDPITETLIVLTYTHYEVHQGCMFKCDVADLDMNEGDTLVLAFRTPPDGELAHVFGEYTTLLGGEFQLWENPTWDNQSGTLQPIINRKREAPFSNSILLEDQGQVAFLASNNLVLNPTGLDLAGEGQISLHHYYAFGVKEKTVGGSGRDDEEFLLKADTQYAYVFTSSAANNKSWISVKWYEHEDGGE